MDWESHLATDSNNLLSSLEKLTDFNNSLIKRATVARGWHRKTASKSPKSDQSHGNSQSEHHVDIPIDGKLNYIGDVTK